MCHVITHLDDGNSSCGCSNEECSDFIEQTKCGVSAVIKLIYTLEVCVNHPERYSEANDSFHSLFVDRSVA